MGPTSFLAEMHLPYMHSKGSLVPIFKMSVIRFHKNHLFIHLSVCN